MQGGWSLVEWAICKVQEAIPLQLQIALDYVGNFSRSDVTEGWF